MGFVDLANLPWKLVAAWTHPPPAPFEAAAHIRNVCNYPVLHRIGSPSQNGVVYEIKMSEVHHAAMKFMVPAPEAQQEVQNAVHLSDFVRTGRLCRFPIVYGSGNCTLAKVNTSTTFGNLARENYQRTALKELVLAQPDLSPRTRVMLRKHTAIPIEQLLLLVPAQDHALVEMILTETLFPTAVLISELMFCDVNALVLHEHEPLRDTNMFAHLVMQIIDGLEELFRARVSHNDIHFGNVLLRVTEDQQLFAVLHDFGTAEMGCEDYRNYVGDIEKLMANLDTTGRNHSTLAAFPSEIQRTMQMCEQVRSMSQLPSVYRVIKTLFSNRITGAVGYQKTVRWLEEEWA